VSETRPSVIALHDYWRRQIGVTGALVEISAWLMLASGVLTVLNWALRLVLLVMS
jgi:hypothetical protein